MEENSKSEITEKSLLKDNIDTGITKLDTLYEYYTTCVDEAIIDFIKARMV